MKVYTVDYSPESLDHLAALFRYIKEQASAEVAEGYVSAVMDYCDGLATFPLRGTARDDIRPGLRITNYKRRAVIAYEVEDDTVQILAVFYGGQDYEAALSEDPDAEDSAP